MAFDVEGQLHSLFSGMLPNENNEDDENMSMEEQIARLKAAYAAYTKKYDFKPGDIVVSKPDCPGPFRLRDRPHVVVETNVEAKNATEEFSPSEGLPRTLRIGRFEQGIFVMYVVAPGYYKPLPT